MYGYSKFVPLTLEEIFKRVSQEEIFGIFIEEEILLDKEKLYCAPYRDDQNGDCYFENYDDTLWFVDFTMNPPPMDCIDFISKVINESYVDALKYINNHFSLGLGDNFGAPKEEVYEVEIKKVEIKKSLLREIKPIIILSRPFENRDRIFWEPYGITKDNLIEDKVLPIKLYRFTSRKGDICTVTPFDITYAYTDFPDNKVKIYRPHGDKLSKWLTNCTQNDVGGLNELPESGDLLIITKSYKDYRVLKNKKLNCIWFQNEAVIPNSQILKDLTERFKRIVVWFDNDVTGLTNGKYVRDIINSYKGGICTYIFLPPVLFIEGIKDPSDLIHKKGDQELIEFLQKHNLYIS